MLLNGDGRVFMAEDGQDDAVIHKMPSEICEGVLQNEKTTDMEVDVAKDNPSWKKLQTGSLQLSPEKVVIPNLPGCKMKVAYKQLADDYEALKKRMLQSEKKEKQMASQLQQQVKIIADQKEQLEAQSVQIESMKKELHQLAAKN